MKRLSIIIVAVFSTMNTMAQTGVAINNSGASPASSAMLDISSINKGVLFPRMSSAQRKALPNPQAGLMVYDLDRTTLYLYDGSKWHPLSFTTEARLPLVERLPTVTGDASIELGSDVDIFGVYAVAGACKETVGLNANQGSAYIYIKDGSWQLHQKINAPDGGNSDDFGCSVAIYNDVIAVGARYAVVNGLSGAGAVYLFKRTGQAWNFLKKIVSPEPESQSYFGSDVAVHNGKLVIGCPNKTINSKSSAGSAWLYEWTNNDWVLSKTFKPAVPLVYGYFGEAVKMYGNDVVIGYPGNVIENIRCGSVQVHTRNPVNNSWSEKEIVNISKQADMSFGAALDIYKDTLIVGAPYYTFSINGESWPKGGKSELYTRSNNNWYNGPYTPGQGIDYQLGVAVAVGINGTRITGSPKEPSGGIAYVGRWPGNLIDHSDVDKLSGTRFGAAAAISGNDFIIGAPGKNNGKGSVQFGVLD